MPLVVAANFLWWLLVVLIVLVVLAVLFRGRL
jgi:hypothetical protein